MKKLNISVALQIRKTIGSNKPEQGGALGMNKDGVIVAFVHDTRGSTSGHTYSPNTKFLNKVFAEWEREGITFCGFIHSHPAGYTRPSSGDQEYARRIIAAMPTTFPSGRIEMPILTFANGEPKTRWYWIDRNGNIHDDQVDIVGIPDSHIYQTSSQTSSPTTTRQTKSSRWKDLPPGDFGQPAKSTKDDLPPGWFGSGAKDAESSANKKGGVNMKYKVSFRLGSGDMFVATEKTRKAATEKARAFHKEDKSRVVYVTTDGEILQIFGYGNLIGC